MPSLAHSEAAVCDQIRTTCMLQNALMASRNEWLTQRMEHGAGLRREAEEKARQCEVSARQLKMRVALFQVRCTAQEVAL